MNAPARPWLQPVYAGAAYFALVFGAGFGFTLLRIPVLAPLMGERNAELAELPFMLVAILLAAQHVVARFTLPRAAGPRLAAGGVALALLLAGELLVLLARKQPLVEYVKSRDKVSGGVYLVMLLAFALMPLVIERLRPPRTPPA